MLLRFNAAVIIHFANLREKFFDIEGWKGIRVQGSFSLILICCKGRGRKPSDQRTDILYVGM